MSRASFRRALLLAVLLLALGPVARAAPIVFQRFEIAMWPEFDKPDVLVMYRVHVGAQVVLPATVRLPVPAGITPHAVAKRGPDGTLYLANYVPVAGQAAIDVEADATELQVEYYAPLQREGTRRSFSWQWLADADIQAFAFEVQEPAGATAFQSTPTATKMAVGANGLTYATAEVGPVPAGRTAAVSFAYEKADEQLSKDVAVPTAPPAVPAATPAAAPALPPVPPAASGTNWWFVAAGAMVVAWLGWTLFRPVRKSDAP